MEVRFYKYLGARNVLDKVLPEPVVKNGSVLNFDYRSPVLVTRGDVTGLTMCYVPSLNRYYFIDNVSYDGDKANLILSCDVLMTFADKIKDVDIDDRQMDRVEAMILSMTPAERAKPSIIDPKRKRRIAAGSGNTVTDVNRLLKQFEQMQKLMKQMGVMGRNAKGKKNKLAVPMNLRRR